MNRPRLADMNAQEIHAELVGDALLGILTPLQRFYDGCMRIGELRGVSPEDAYQEIRGEVLSFGGVGVFMGSPS